MIVNLKSQTDLSGFYVVFEGSTNLEERGIFGISHLMEHLICKNYQHYRKKFERYGIDWNASTSSNEIVFYFTGLDKYLSPMKMDLVDLITSFDISKEVFENERKIILQEYKNTFSDQSSNHLLNLSRKLFKNYSAIGLKEDLESLTFMDCMNFFEKQFTNPSKIINVSKKDAFKIDLDFTSPKIEKIYEFGPYKDVLIESNKFFGDKVSVTMISKLYDKDFNYVSFLNKMLSLGLSSPLYRIIREKKGLVYNLKCDQNRMNKQGFTIINTETSEKNAEEVLNTIKKIIEQPSKYLPKSRFETVKNAYKIKYEKDRINRFSNVSMWINPSDWSVKEILETITYEQVMDIYEDIFNFDNFYLSIDKNEFR